MHTHCVHVFNGGDGDAVIRGVADELQLDFLPAQDGFLDQHVRLRRSHQAVAGDAVQIIHVVRQAGAEPAHGERGAHHTREPQLRDGLLHLFHGEADAGAGGFAANLVHDVLEFLAVLAALDGVDVRADELHAVLFQNAEAVQLDRRVQRSLAAEGGQNSVDRVALLGFAGEDAVDVAGLNRFHVGVVGKLGVGHDRRRVRVDQRHPQAFVLEHAARLGAGVVELAGLANHDRAGADDQDVVQIVTLHVCISWSFS